MPTSASSVKRKCSVTAACRRVQVLGRVVRRRAAAPVELRQLRRCGSARGEQVDLVDQVVEVGPRARAVAARSRRCSRRTGSAPRRTAGARRATAVRPAARPPRQALAVVGLGEALVELDGRRVRRVARARAVVFLEQVDGDLGGRGHRDPSLRLPLKVPAGRPDVRADSPAVPWAIIDGAEVPMSTKADRSFAEQVAEGIPAELPEAPVRRPESQSRPPKAGRPGLRRERPRPEKRAPVRTPAIAPGAGTRAGERLVADGRIYMHRFRPRVRRCTRGRSTSTRRSARRPRRSC